MDIIFDLFALRNVNRPYTDKELDETYKKDFSIQDEGKQSRLKRCVSINDTELLDVHTHVADDQNEEGGTSSFASDANASADVASSTVTNDPTTEDVTASAKTSN
jgi:hypothetical protein